MNQRFHIAEFFGRWHRTTRHDLSASHSQTLSLSALLALATPAERAGWETSSLEYGAPAGTLQLRALIAARYRGLDAEDIVCAAGAQEGLACVAQALLQPNDHAIVVLPLYQPLEWTISERAHATGVVLEPNGFALDLDRVAAAIRPDTRLILTNFPNSPTGATLDPSTRSALVSLCRARGLWLVNDEVYRQTSCQPDGLSPPVAEIYERGISINSLSKGFGLPGIRVGWIACRDRILLERVILAKAALSNCIAAPSQILAEIALREERRLVDRARAIGASNRTLLDRILGRHPRLFELDRSANLAFAYPRYLGSDGAAAFAERLAAEWGILLFPSSLWSSRLGTVPTDRLRISLGQAEVAKGLRALEAFLDAALVT
jgi:aspartate/methionine/tyrosine aminotransferase